VDQLIRESMTAVSPNVAPIAEPSPIARTSRPLLGIAFMCLASTLFPIMNGLVQVLSPRYPTEQLVWLRTVSHLVIISALFLPKFGVGLIHSNELGAQIIRSMLLLASTTMFFTGVKSLPLAKAASISFTAPLLVALLAWPLLGERITLARVLAVSAGFTGVLIVIRPGSDVFQWASLYILGSASCYAFYQIVTRKVAGVDRPETSAVYSALLGAIVMSVFAVPVWIWPHSLTDWALILSLGLWGGLGHYCVARAMTYGPANVIAPFMYWQMVGSIAIGYLVSGILPDQYVWAGAALIISAGLFLGWWETRARRASV
jgi:drug/metabolite transporter (DMT)-like permease